jgi:hypothetical protein
MAKASDRKGIRTEEYECCARVRRRWMDTIRRDFLTFPVIKDVACPTCKMVLKIRVYSREEAEAQAAT